MHPLCDGITNIQMSWEPNIIFSSNEKALLWYIKAEINFVAEITFNEKV